MVRYSIIVDGRVQGVGFRYFTQMIAMRYNLTGWCKNLSDGKVQMEVQGPKENVINFISAIRKGNHFSRIDDMDLSELTIKENEKKYRITY
ncbi:MAG: acylphosphatase [Clostridium sp.]|nr:acylphosphatase [Clostridium sp.]